MTALLVAKLNFNPQVLRWLDRLRVPAASVIATGVTTLLDFALTPEGIAARLPQRDARAGVALEAA
jgi:hypothetical protein